MANWLIGLFETIEENTFVQINQQKHQFRLENFVGQDQVTN